MKLTRGMLHGLPVSLALWALLFWAVRAVAG